MNILTKRVKFAVHDWETTGLTKHPDAPLSIQPRGIEFAGVITDGVEILDEVEFICNPGIEIEEVITKITGLTNDDLVKQPYFDHFVPKLKDYFGQADIAVSHNLSFDRAITTYDLRRIDLTLEDINWPKIEICTVEQVFQQFGRRVSLQDLYKMYVGPYVQKHRALDDVRLLTQVCSHIGLFKAFGVVNG